MRFRCLGLVHHLISSRLMVVAIVVAAFGLDGIAAAQDSGIEIAAPDAQADVTAPETEVVGHYETGIGTSDAASQGRFTQRVIQDRPILRPGEVLEFVPGMAVTQHSGGGKANQYFLRGFNLDHGTDFAVTVAGMPVNMPTHGHGQGYADINFIIPELISSVDFRKGPYFADKGDFSSAGSADINYFTRLPDNNLGSVTIGEDEYVRGLLIGTPSLGTGNLIYGVEAYHNNGPWTLPENYRKFNGVLGYNWGNSETGFTILAMAYQGKWNSTDQIPLRAVDSGLITDLDAIDTSDGGESTRYSLSAQGQMKLGRGFLQANAYYINYALDLWSNFTFFLDDPVNGDQFQQTDRRNVYGANVAYLLPHRFGMAESQTRVGLQTRYDDIGKVALSHTVRKTIIGTTREDSVGEWGTGFWIDNSTQWSSWFRSYLGLRYDYYRFDVEADIPQNSGDETAGIVSPKLSFIFGPWNRTEYFINAGAGFHSNDARGVTITVDPLDPTVPADPATPLVRTKGAELGVRTEIIPKLQSSLALFYLKVDSELLFVGDAGITEPSRPSQRIGIEWINYWRPLPWLLIDAELALTQSRFTDNDPVGDYIPGSVPSVFQLGAYVENYRNFFGGIQLRYLGPRPLTEDDSVRSNPSTVVNLRAGYNFTPKFRMYVDVLNLFDSDSHYIDYYYPSRLPGEPADGVNDIHFHPVEPIQVRLTAQIKF